PCAVPALAMVANEVNPCSLVITASLNNSNGSGNKSDNGNNGVDNGYHSWRQPSRENERQEQPFLAMPQEAAKPIVERMVPMMPPNDGLAKFEEIAAAQREAQRITSEAQREAQHLRREAERYVMQVLTELEAELQRTLATIKNGRQYLQQRRRKQASII
ncbi:MAG: hypothetical protein HY692_09610, partial [Cyanobacteria bacterium NC_groundwater_1444_Ag_S-0.65um_54_12]|nr:hypothetical protein [Cyanobacteria bacterium NC_groundwater_1444_Ag_S-0.65um_54_12]